MQSRAATVEEYLADLPADRRQALEVLRKVFRDNLDPRIEEGMQYGMIGYYVPHSIFPAGYHCDPKQPLPFACLASQKNHMSLYSMHLYGEPRLLAWFQEAWAATGRKLDMGKSCIRFKRLEDLALDVVAELLRRSSLPEYLAAYEASRDGSSSSPRKSAMAAKGPKKSAKAAPRGQRRHGG